MTIAKTIIDYLQKNHIPYAVLPHPHTATSRRTAEETHILPERLAKAVVLRDGHNYVMAVVPGNRHVKVETLSEKLGRHLQLADEDRLTPVFRDCTRGAIPPLGPAYGMETILDDSLVGQPEIYFEAGDHEEVICVQGDQFVLLLKEARHGRFSH